MQLDHTTFFAYIRRAPFGGRLTQQQVDGVKCILQGWEQCSAGADADFLAYILATAFHETGGRMVPVREGFAKSDAAARRIIATRKYGKVDAETGHVYYGRGVVQLTWAINYKNIGQKLGGLDLYRNPDLALQPEISARILVRGMMHGWFTGKRLAQFFAAGVNDPIGARRIINGTDKAHLIAGYHDQFLGAIQAADIATALPPDVKPADAEADSASLVTDKTTVGGIAGMVASGGVGAGIFAGVDNVYALAAVVVAMLLLAVGAWLFFSGRLEIRRKAGA